jgi:hypothetical protein
VTGFAASVWFIGSAIASPAAQIEGQAAAPRFLFVETLGHPICPIRFRFPSAGSDCPLAEPGRNDGLIDPANPFVQRALSIRVVPHGLTCSTLYFDFRVADLLSF